jgi:hypothetical protein
MTAWAGLTGPVNAQQPATDPPTRGTSVSQRPATGVMPQRYSPLRAARLGGPLPAPASWHPAEAQADGQKTDPPVPGKSPSDAPVREPAPSPRPATTAGPAAVPVPIDQGYVEAPGYGYPGAYPRPGAPSGRFWTNLEWLVWATSGQHVPPAITTGPVGPAQPGAGVIGNPGTTILWPLDRVNNEFRSGFRLTGGYWFDDTQSFGVEGDFFFLGNSKKGLSVRSDSNGNQIIARPFVDARTGLPAAVLVSAPGVSFGTAEVRAENSAIGAGVGLLYDMSSDPCGRLCFSIGYRYLGVFDEVSFQQDSTALVASPGVAFATRSQITDRFNTDNNFHGFNIGVNAERKVGYWYFGGRASVALGGVQQVVVIDGRTVLTVPNVPTQATFQGLYAQSSNIGRYERTEFAVLPEFGVRFGVQLTESGRLYVGYNWMYLSNVVRAGDQIDTRVNPGFLPGGGGSAIGPPLPAFRGFQTTDYWLQGVSFGLEIRF